jgi:DNA primase
MLRAARLVAGRRVELRVVPLPSGSDPADIASRDGAEAVRSLLERAVPFARFEVERTLERGELGSAEGRGQVVSELRPIFAGLGDPVVYDDLLRLAANRLDASADLLARELRSGGSGLSAGGGGRPVEAGQLASGGRPSGPAGARAAWDRFEDTERAFLARCLAMPESAEDELAELDIDELFTSDLTRRAAHYLRTHLHNPGEGLADMDADLTNLIAELVLRASALGPDAAALRLERLQLDKIRLDREIAAAQRRGEPVTELAAERQRIHDEIRHRLV